MAAHSGHGRESGVIGNKLLNLKMEYKEIKAEHSPIRCFEFSGDFPGRLYLDFDDIDMNGMITTTCIIDTTNGRYSTIAKLNIVALNDNEPLMVESLVSMCVDRYKKDCQ